MSGSTIVYGSPNSRDLDRTWDTQALWALRVEDLAYRQERDLALGPAEDRA